MKLLKEVWEKAKISANKEREALEAGTVTWDGELFTGRPDWMKLMSRTPPKLTTEEQAFLDGPVEELCRMTDDWDITHELGDLPEEVWQYIRENRFFAMIIPKEYGGLGFSPIANAAVLAKLWKHFQKYLNISNFSLLLYNVIDCNSPSCFVVPIIIGTSFGMAPISINVLGSSVKKGFLVKAESGDPNHGVGYGIVSKMR